MSNFDPYTYACEFSKLAGEYALEALERGDLNSTTMEEWAYETAQDLEAVIYYHQALSLFTAGYFDDVDDQYAVQLWRSADSAQLTILNVCCALSYTWHYDHLYEAAGSVLPKAHHN